MDNVQMVVKGDILTITVDLSKRGEKSSTGKTVRIGSTCGNVPVPSTNSGAIIGLNVYTKQGV